MCLPSYAQRQGKQLSGLWKDQRSESGVRVGRSLKQDHFSPGVGNHESDPDSFPRSLLLLHAYLQDSESKAMFALREESPHIRFIRAVRC